MPYTSTGPQLPTTVTYDQTISALSALAPDLDPRDVMHVLITPTAVTIHTWDGAEETSHMYRVEHPQGAATEGSGR